MARGWEALGSWQPEAFLAPQPPGGRTVQQKRQAGLHGFEGKGAAEKEGGVEGVGP